MVIAAGVRPASIALVLTRKTPRWFLNPYASVSASYSSSSPSRSRKLVLYSKPGCCLCDGLKDKIGAAFLLSGPDSLHDVDLYVRDITRHPRWERAYQYLIPVLAKVRSDGTEETLPQLSPRLGVKLIQKKLAAALREQET